ncbi:MULTISPECIES: ABC transporter ATP-binding protein [Desulfosporosinus]|uniref:Spermidine/putrescine import ATP-binding protein PotA n=1 Tax=Desulfosporosinus acididurans TaxID=476652 RepID=A0A0J1FSK0_9FIRM|nr:MULTISPECIES: ABC transporter ATP-binding protein [Desulfosporosinus]KLU65953.1 spermidine/putrescine import ATP-binding protein PotA [Desulfosporosinus acididurans]
MAQVSDKVMVELRNVDKFYGANKVVKNLNLQIREGEFLTMLGPSGCGKTTTLRMIAGFEAVTSGAVIIEGEDVGNKAPYQRNVNTVFQNYALFPHMNIYDNIAFGLTEKKVKKEEIRQRVGEMLSLVQMDGYEKRMPSQLSGGQKQRVAIARALVNRPKVLLLDEPLGALDLKLRKQMQVELKHLQRQLGITFVYVTHDQEESLTMSDRIAVMNSGILEQIGPPDKIYNQPATKFVADFIGESNIFEASVGSVDGDNLNVIFETGSAEVSAAGFSHDEMVYISVRPEKLKCSAAVVPGFNIRGTVKEHIYVGSIIKTIIELPNGQELKMSLLAGTPLISPGEVVWVYWEKDSTVVLHTHEETLYNLIEQVPKIEVSV